LLCDLISTLVLAGVRLGEQVAKDMVAVRIGPDVRMALVGSPSYFAGRPRPRTSQDFNAHSSINLRLPTLSGFYTWEFERGRREQKVRVEGHSCSTATP
jgi:DNA-binding transcriptional LysR family regulator